MYREDEDDDRPAPRVRQVRDHEAADRRDDDRRRLDRIDIVAEQRALDEQRRAHAEPLAGRAERSHAADGRTQRLDAAPQRRLLVIDLNHT